MVIVSHCSYYTKRILVFCLQGIRPIHKMVLGPAFCKYGLGCTEFAIAQIQHHNLAKAGIRICLRLLSCNPWTRPIKSLEQ